MNLIRKEDLQGKKEENVVDILNLLYSQLCSECIEQIIKDQNKGVNWHVVLIRKYNRQWNEVVEEAVPPMKDFFIRNLKEDLLKQIWPNDMMAAFKYL